MAVDVIQKVLRLQAIFWAHFVQNEGLHCTFKFSYTEYFGLDSYFFKESFEKNSFGGEAVKVNASQWV